MRKLFVFFISAIILAFVGLTFQKQIINFFYYSPCSTPISYKLGEIDSGFNETSQQFLGDIHQAVMIWEVAYGKQLFVYDPKAILTVNFIYDERQALTNQINNLDNQLSTEKSSLTPQMQEYQAKVHTFEQQLSELNSQIAYWNSKGGAPKDVYDQLLAQQNNLKQQAAELNQMAQTLNRATDTYNAQVGELNQTVGSLDQVAQVKPEEGLYDPNNNTISIYYNHGHDELVHTLAHEFGHALGMQHEDNPDAIMYTQTNLNITPTSEDLAQLRQVCRYRTVVDRVQEVIQRIKESIQASQS